MIIEHYLFLFGVFLMSVGVSYAWWLKLRIIWFRQDIYDLRDELFMEAVRLECPDDTCFRTARDHLNALAMIAPVLSIPFLANAIELGIAKVVRFPISKSDEVNCIVERVMSTADKRIARYLLRETLTGLVIIPSMRLMSMAFLEDKIIDWVRKWRESRAVEDALPLIQKRQKIRL